MQYVCGFYLSVLEFGSVFLLYLIQILVILMSEVKKVLRILGFQQCADLEVLRVLEFQQYAYLKVLQILESQQYADLEVILTLESQQYADPEVLRILESQQNVCLEVLRILEFLLYVDPLILQLQQSVVVVIQYYQLYAPQFIPQDV